jgi:predicted acyl esterase
MKHFILKTAARIMMLAVVITGLSFQGTFAQQVLPKPGNLNKYDFRMLPSMAPESDASYTVIKNDFWLTMRDGKKLDCSKFYPSEPNPFLPNGYPVVIMVHGYGDSKVTLENFAQQQAAFNYVVYTYSVRGQGLSEGLSDLISITDAEDLKELVNYIKRDNVGLDSTKIIITGGSQGGTVPYMAACNGMKVAGIISALTSPEFASSWIENGSVKMTFLWTIEYTPDTARYTPLVDRMSDWVYATGVKSNLWDSLAINVPKNRDFKSKVSANTVPLLIENSWQDYFFNARQCIASFGSVTAPTRVYLGAVMGHGGDISETENQWHMNFFNEFFYNYVWGVPQNFETRPKFHYASTTFPRVGPYWDFKHDSSAVWPPQGLTNTRMYLRSNKKLSTTSESSSSTTVQFKNSVANNYSLQTAVYSEFTGADFNSKFKKDSTYWESDVVTTPVKMIGTPKVNFEYASSTDICQYNFQLFEVKAGGDVKFITRLNYTDRKYTTNQRKRVTVEGTSHAHIISAGSKLRVVVTNLDRTPDDVKFLETNPYVLPVMKNSTNKIYLKDSYIEMPVMIPTGDAIAFETLDSPKLYQNYPNPFNPSTNIKFEIPENYEGLVTLKIYDMVGREVATLINDHLSAGIHEVQWNALGFSSGVYFSRVTLGNQQSDISRMLLIK